MIFRRIHGRIVPIREERAKGVAIAGAGVGVAAASGRIAARMTHRAAQAENEARGAVKAARAAKSASEKLGPLFSYKSDRAYAQAGHAALKTMAKSRGLFEQSLKVRNVGHAAGAALVGAGVHKALKGTELEKHPKTKAAVAGGAAVAAHFAVRSSYLKGVGNKSFRSAAMAGAELLAKGLKRVKA